MLVLLRWMGRWGGVEGAQEVDAVSEVLDEALCGIVRGNDILLSRQVGRRTTVLTSLAAVESNVKDAIRSGISSA